MHKTDLSRYSTPGSADAARRSSAADRRPDDNAPCEFFGEAPGIGKKIKSAQITYGAFKGYPFLVNARSGRSGRSPHERRYQRRRSVERPMHANQHEGYSQYIIRIGKRRMDPERCTTPCLTSDRVWKAVENV